MLKTPFQEIRATVGTGSLTSKALKAALGLAICALALCASRTAQAQSETWNNTAGKNWVSTGNWSNSTVPGTTGVAEFDADPTDSGSSNGLGIAFTSGTVNNGSFSGASGSLPDQGVGAISVTSLHAQSSIFFGSTGTGGGYMTFSGATVGGIANTILSNMSSGNLHIQNQVNGGSGSFGVVLGATNNIIQTAAGLSSTTNGVSVEILSTINEATAGSSITLYGGGASGTTGGVLELAGTNSFTGGITIGLSDGSGNQAGTVQIDASYALPTTGAILVNANSDLLLNTSGTYGGVGQSLTLNGAGTVANSGALQTGGGGQSVTWQGNLTLGSNSYISVSNGAGTLTISGTFKDGGFTLQKQGSGNLILSGDNTMTGATMMGNGTLTVNPGSSMGSGNLQMNAGNGNNTAVVLNNGAQTIGNLSSSPSSNGSETQTITLNSTALTIDETGTTSFGLGSGNSGSTPETSTITGNGSVILGATSTGILTFTGTQTYTGGTTINGGTLQINRAAYLPATGNFVINNNGALGLGGAGTNGAAGQSITLNGGGNANSSGALVGNGSGVAWQGSVNLASNSTIDVTSGNDLTLSGTLSDGGNQLQKQGGGILYLSGARNNMTGGTRIGNGTLQVDSGSSMGSGALQMGQTSTNSTVLALDNAAQTVGNLSSTFSATSSTTAGTYTQVITLNSTALTVDETGTTTFGNAIVSSSISQTSTIGGSGSVTLAAASTGALTFTGTQTYSGGTQVNGGALYMNGSLNGSNGANATVNVTEAGVLGGTGVIGGLVTGSNGGTITAGGAAGTIGELTLQNGLDLHAGGTFVWDLLDEADNSTGTAGTDFDQLELTGGALTLGGSSALTLDILSGSSSDAFWASNHTWTIINSSAALTGSGNFSQITDATYGTGTFTTTPDGSGDVTLNYTAGAVVPEPSAYACIALGGASLLAWGRRKRARRTE